MPELQDSTAQLSPLKRAYLAMAELEARLENASKATREPIAVVGMGCRFPGGATTPDAFWRLLRDGIDAVREVPADRWNAGAMAASPVKMNHHD